MRPTDNECSSVGSTQLSDTGVGDKLTVVGQVTRGIAGQGRVDESRNLEHDALPHWKPVQLAEHIRNRIASPGACHEPGGSVLNWLQAARQFVGDAVAQRVTVVQATDNKKVKVNVSVFI